MKNIINIIVPCEISVFKTKPACVEAREHNPVATKSYKNNVQAKNMYFAKRHLNQYNRARANIKFAKRSFQLTQGK